MKKLLLLVGFLLVFDVKQAQCNLSLISTITTTGNPAHDNSGRISIANASPVVLVNELFTTTSTQYARSGNANREVQSSFVKTGGEPLNGDVLLANGATYYPSNGTYTSSRTSVLLNIPDPKSVNTITNNGAVLYVNSGGRLTINGGFVNELNSDLVNNGEIDARGDLINNGNIGTASFGTLHFDGNSPQTLNGSAAFVANRVTIDNAAGVTLNTPLRVTGEVDFLNGILHANEKNWPLIFTDEATANKASDESHVFGYVVKQGTGSFTYPIGSRDKYQPVTVNLTENSDGVFAKYRNGDAGTAPFGNLGSSATLLDAYNPDEHWDLHPLGTATGKVRLYWDNYGNSPITNSSNINVYKVAHKVGEAWRNEGGNASGTEEAGSVESNSISSWSPFTLGAISESALPVTLASFEAIIEEDAALLIWTTTFETNSKHFDVERSSNGKTWKTIGSVAATNNSSILKNYRFADSSPLAGENLYRLRMVDLDGTFAYSRVRSLSFGELASMLVYPNPAREGAQVRINKRYVGSKVKLINSSGVVLRELTVHSETFLLDLKQYTSGFYVLQAKDGKSIKIIKQ